MNEGLFAKRPRVDLQPFEISSISVSLASPKAMYLVDAESDSSASPQEAMHRVVL